MDVNRLSRGPGDGAIPPAAAACAAALAAAAADTAATSAAVVFDGVLVRAPCMDGTRTEEDAAPEGVDVEPLAVPALTAPDDKRAEEPAAPAGVTGATADGAGERALAAAAAAADAEGCPPVL